MLAWVLNTLPLLPGDPEVYKVFTSVNSSRNSVKYLITKPINLLIFH